MASQTDSPLVAALRYEAEKVYGHPLYVDNLTHGGETFESYAMGTEHGLTAVVSKKMPSRLIYKCPAVARKNSVFKRGRKTRNGKIPVHDCERSPVFECGVFGPFHPDKAVGKNGETGIARYYNGLGAGQRIILGHRLQAYCQRYGKKEQFFPSGIRNLPRLLQEDGPKDKCRRKCR